MIDILFYIIVQEPGPRLRALLVVSCTVLVQFYQMDTLSVLESLMGAKMQLCTFASIYKNQTHKGYSEK